MLVLSSNCPAKQSVHAVLPFLAKRPVAHEMHANDPSTSDFVSAAQSVQLLLKVAPLFGFFFPAAQLLQSSGLVKPVADEYRPSGHPMQTLMETAPVSVVYNPAGQSFEFKQNKNGKKEEKKNRYE